MSQTTRMSHAERKARRREMVKLVRMKLRAGGSAAAIDEVAAQFGVHPRTVLIACREAKVKPPGRREERRNRRREMAEMVRAKLKHGGSGSAVDEVAMEFKVRLPIVRTACREAGIELPRRRSPRQSQLPTKTLSIIAEIVACPKKTLSEIARERGISRQRVFQIKSAAEANGLLAAVD